MTPAPKRRWFRFSLRTLFVVVTVFCSWLGYELNWIRERHELLARQKAIAVGSEEIALPTCGLSWLWVPPKVDRAPSPLWIFGEQPITNLEITQIVDDDVLNQPQIAEQREFELAHSLFPEAIVIWRLARVRKDFAESR